LDTPANLALDFSQFRVLTFDCYGTLIDWESGILVALNRALDAHGRAIPAQQLLAAYSEIEPQIQSEDYRLYRDVLAEVMRRLGTRFNIGFTPAEIASLAESIREWQPYPDTVAALCRLKSRYQLAIISNIDDDLFAHSAKKLDVPFDFVITAQQVGSYKPSLRNFEVALQRIGLPKEKVLHVAESIFHDVVPAGSLGLKTVWVDRQRQTGMKATKATSGRSDLTVMSLRELADAAFNASSNAADTA
jgi:2-haloacid dehalogenase